MGRAGAPRETMPSGLPRTSVRRGTDGPAGFAGRSLGWGALLLALLTGCAMSRDPSHWMEQRTAIEQLLFSQAVERSVAPISLPLPEGATVSIDVVAPSPPLLLSFVRDMVAKRLGAQGLRVQKQERDAAYLVRVLAQSLGTEQGKNLIGLPSMQSALLPISTPEIALFKEEHNQALIRLLLDVSERETGRHILSTRWYEGETHFNQYTVFVVIGYRMTNLVIPN
ncbi:MAG: hypothetical protein AB1411_13180 [Nitrospirota bacterium]